MGWTYINKPDGKPETYFPHRLLQDPDDLKAVARVKDGTFDALYMAIDIQGLRTLAFVVLLDESPREIGYKVMDESMGPMACSAPLEVLKELTNPAPNEWAAEWRRKCRYKPVMTNGCNSQDPDLAYVP